MKIKIPYLNGTEAEEYQRVFACFQQAMESETDQRKEAVCILRSVTGHFNRKKESDGLRFDDRSPSTKELLIMQLNRFLAEPMYYQEEMYYYLFRAVGDVLTYCEEAEETEKKYVSPAVVRTLFLLHKHQERLKNIEAAEQYLRMNIRTINEILSIGKRLYAPLLTRKELRELDELIDTLSVKIDGQPLMIDSFKLEEEFDFLLRIKART